jgi:hypothetical protein
VRIGRRAILKGLAAALAAFKNLRHDLWGLHPQGLFGLPREISFEYFVGAGSE